MIAVVDYGMGNLRSVHKALERAGLQSKVTDRPGDIDDARGVVLPGVGAFADCMKSLDELGLIGPLTRSIEKGKPFLGICLGLQVLFTESEEFGPCQGLDLLSGKVVRFPEGMLDPEDGAGPPLKVPHMGWNQVEKKIEEHPLKKVPDSSFFYFVHSFYVLPEDESIIATSTTYGLEFASSVKKENVYACQFHPEKSQRAGIELLAGFREMLNAQ